MSELSVTSREDGPFTVVEVSGDVDLISAPVLRGSLESLFRDANITLVMDLRDVGFIDSTGLGVLVGAVRAVTPHGGLVRIACASERVLRVFSITGLDQILDVYPTPEDAVAAGVDESADEAAGSR